MRWSVATVALVLAGCTDQGAPIEEEDPTIAPFCGEGLQAYNDRIGALVSWDPNEYSVRVERYEANWAILLTINATFGIQGEVQVRKADLGSPPIWQAGIDVGPFCDLEVWTMIPPQPGSWVLTLLHDDEVTLSPEIAFAIVANETATTITPQQHVPPQVQGNATSWIGPWFRAWGDTENESVVAHGDAFSLIGIRTALPATPNGFHNVRLVPLEGDWRRAGQDPWLDGNLTSNWGTLYRVIAPPDGTGRIGVQVDWPFQEYPTYQPGAYCWVLSLATTDHVDVAWERDDGPCR